MMKINGPYYGCSQGDCSSEASYPANELCVFGNEVWCTGCLENEVPRNDYENHCSVFVPPVEAKTAILMEAVQAVANDMEPCIDSAHFKVKTHLGLNLQALLEAKT